MTPIIDYKKISLAQSFFEAHGFKEIPVPWIIGHEAYNATRPIDRRDFYCLGGYLNASGEQSFLELMLKGIPLTKHLCVTACFREEPVSDALHHTHFVKVELINTEVSKKNLEEMICTAQTFFDQFLPPHSKSARVHMDASGNTIDIVDRHLGIELGSYGIRRYKEHEWIYGTGLALPRLDTVLHTLNTTQG